MASEIVTSGTSTSIVVIVRVGTVGATVATSISIESAKTLKGSASVTLVEISTFAGVAIEMAGISTSSFVLVAGESESSQPYVASRNSFTS